MEINSNIALIVVLAPLVGFLINVFFGKNLGKTLSGVIGTVAVLISFVSSCFFFSVLSSGGAAITVSLFEWIQIGTFKVDLGFLIDQLSVL